MLFRSAPVEVEKEAAGGQGGEAQGEEELEHYPSIRGGTAPMEGRFPRQVLPLAGTQEKMNGSM